MLINDLYIQIQKQEAQKIIDDIGIMPVLKSIGDARVVGSVALDVIMKRDIDKIHLLIFTFYTGYY